MSNIIVVTLLNGKETREQHGLIEFEMNMFQGKNHLKNKRFIVNSGQPGHQRLTSLANDVSGRQEPCPEGIHKLGTLEWREKQNYNSWFPNIQSPIWVTIGTDTIPERGIGIHLDGNRSWAPGTIGCLGLKTLDDVKSFVDAYNGYGQFEKLIMYCGLGYVKKEQIPDYVRAALKI